ncbi:SH2 domain-containing protein 2A isoform X1 [Cricetulus griseus]|uniref:SH2 domain-containing protein 2A isoform X1 n=1 Tax=Cricetulus griseus TaxID=10029 RepID=A0A9J7HCU7_CRIGR|nr:SH2 domain-containing protein 2A isoform X1 [Cricetulus griseus]XP_035312071.1 SH2 domain-containing protein 2A isoform X1 [Cricetulus griseus]
MEFCLAQTCPQGNHEAPSPTFSTFQPMNLTQGRCQELGWGSKPSMQAPKEEKAQLSPRATHTMVSKSMEGNAWVLGNADKEEEVPGKGGLSLQAETREWVQKTQAHWLLLKTAPVWFHGFITRREAERLLQPQPQGCYLVRFSESAVTFVLSYRSRTCCRHFLLAQLGDGRHVVLGEDSAHAQLQDLLQHYTECPLSPYGEMLTQPLARQTAEPAGLFMRTESVSGSKRQEDPDSQHSLLIQQGQAQAPAHKEKVWASQPKGTSPRPRPPIPAKPLLPLEVYTSPASRSRRAPPTNPIYQEPDEPIAFYAMGRGSPGEAPSNIYAEVEGPSGMAPTGHPILQKCWSRPISGGQVKGAQGKKNSRRPAERGSPS